jgi:hypothetical protein
MEKSGNLRQTKLKLARLSELAIQRANYQARLQEAQNKYLEAYSKAGEEAGSLFVNLKGS